MSPSVWSSKSLYRGIFSNQALLNFYFFFLLLCQAPVTLPYVGVQVDETKGQSLLFPAYDVASPPFFPFLLSLPPFLISSPPSFRTFTTPPLMSEEPLPGGPHWLLTPQGTFHTDQVALPRFIPL